jgi:hypothetical protein
MNGGCPLRSSYRVAPRELGVELGGAQELSRLCESFGGISDAARLLVDVCGFRVLAGARPRCRSFDGVLRLFVGHRGAIVAADLFEQNRCRLELTAFEKKLSGFALLAGLESQTGTLQVFAGGGWMLPFHGDKRTEGR